MDTVSTLPGKTCIVKQIGPIGLIILSIALVFLQQASANPGSPYTLIPPGNCQAENVECGGHFTWAIPDSSGNLPPGLLGYNLYRNGSFLFNISDPYGNSTYDFPDPGSYQYSVTAWYDLTPYGLPGQFGESASCVMDSIALGCYMLFPFLEDWNQGSFQFYDWRFLPAQGNWAIIPGSGNPSPAAGFEGSPAQSSYSFTLRSPVIWGIPYTCADFSFSYDYQLEDIAASGTEHLETGVMINGTAYPYDTLSNTGSTGWIYKEIDIDQVGGQGFEVYFRAYGSNSSDITRWMIDNINVTMTCKPVTDLEYSLSGDIVSLSWNHPCDTVVTKNSILTGYVIYRTDQTGQPPYVKMNNDPVKQKHFVDTLPSTGPEDQYRYFIMTLFSYETMNPVCQSPGDTILVVPAAGINDRNKGSFTVLPNPGQGLFTLHMTGMAGSFRVSDMQGTRILRESIPAGTLEMPIDLSGYPGGIYFLEIKTSRSTVILKIIKM